MTVVVTSLRELIIESDFMLVVESYRSFSDVQPAISKGRESAFALTVLELQMTKGKIELDATQSVLYSDTLAEACFFDVDRRRWRGRFYCKHKAIPKGQLAPAVFDFGRIENALVHNVWPAERPNYSSAVIDYANLDGRGMSEEELVWLNTHREFVIEQVRGLE